MQAEDTVSSIRYILDLRHGNGGIDDIDHLGNRRGACTIAELAADEFHKGFLKLRKTAQEQDEHREENLTPRVQSTPRRSARRSTTSSVAAGSRRSSTRPALSQLTHERRLSALGPNGLNRKRAGFEVRDVHLSHYGRICRSDAGSAT
ncbi:MAG: hypothetical protein R3F20_09670 [Planctomycetota bacterium]